MLCAYPFPANQYVRTALCSRAPLALAPLALAPLALAAAAIANPPVVNPPMGPHSHRAGQTRPPLANCTILIIRHAEKPDIGPDLTPEGVARANAYVGYFTNLVLDGKKWETKHIFAAADSKDSHRPRLTVAPLAAALGQPPDLRFGSKDVAELAADLQTHRYGRDVLICWRHSKIPDLVTALGADAEALFHGSKWPANVYDWVVEIPFDSKGKVKLQQEKLIHEHLLPPDPK